MPKPYPRGFSKDVIRVGCNHEPGALLKGHVADLGISESCPTNRLCKRLLLREQENKALLFQQPDPPARRAEVGRFTSRDPGPVPVLTAAWCSHFDNVIGCIPKSAATCSRVTSRCAGTGHPHDIAANSQG